MKIILAECADPVIMIDDFRVPFDPGYEWDDYGPGNRVDLEQLKWLQSSDCRFFFPVAFGHSTFALARDAERQVSGAAGSGSEARADAVCRRLQTFVRQCFW